jgi:lipopolysaccharide/colanic/teichoic acid biosynthesis glycosyltransferase
MSKRVFDLLFGILALILAMPLMAVSAFMVYLEDGAPVIFRQKRVGRDGKLFEIYKLRTMVKNAEHLQSQAGRFDVHGNLIHKTKDDPRITHIGRMLRRFSIDELPQLFNVLDGTMSLVGPRPEMPHVAETYQPWQRDRLTVLPGMTGWWQINGRSDKPMHLHVEDDLYYVQHHSICLDLKIIIRTLWVVLIGKGAY